jgi:hypothetical protein
MQALPTSAEPPSRLPGGALGGMAKWRLHRFCSPRLQRQHPHAVWPRTGQSYSCRRRHRCRSKPHSIISSTTSSPHEVTVKAIKEVSGAGHHDRAYSLRRVCACGFHGRSHWAAYQQFAITVAVAVVFSAINALTLSPLDREKARAIGVKVKSVFQTLQAYLSED